MTLRFGIQLRFRTSQTGETGTASPRDMQALLTEMGKRNQVNRWDSSPTPSMRLDQATLSAQFDQAGEAVIDCRNHSDIAAIMALGLQARDIPFERIG